MAALGNSVKGTGHVYLTGGATALLHGWRDTTIDVDLKANPEPAGFFEAIASLKDSLDVNIDSPPQINSFLSFPAGVSAAASSQNMVPSSSITMIFTARRSPKSSVVMSVTSPMWRQCSAVS